MSNFCSDCGQRLPVCPACGAESTKAIYTGFPMNFCLEDDCHTVWGIWSWIPVAFPVDPEGFAFYLFHGAYVIALYHWLKGDDGYGDNENFPD
jgi:hypothetical protein